MNCFAKFEKLLPYSIIMLSFMTVGGQMPELDRGASPPPIHRVIETGLHFWLLVPGDFGGNAHRGTR